MDQSEREELLTLLEITRMRYRRAFTRSTATWYPIPFLPMRINSVGIAMLWTALHGVLFLAGATLIFVGTPVDNLGFALVLGSLFASGAFGAQVWTVAFQREKQLREQTVGPTYFHEDVVRLGAELQAITAKLAALDRTPPYELPLSRLSVDQIRRRLFRS